MIREDRSGGIFRVHRLVFSSAEIATLGQANIFQRCWLYLGHDSEIPNVGDYQRRTVAGQPLFVAAASGRVRAFYNSCTHWGANVCRVDQGNAEVFQCFSGARAGHLATVCYAIHSSWRLIGKRWGLHGSSSTVNQPVPFGLSLSTPCAALRQAQRERWWG